MNAASRKLVESKTLAEVSVCKYQKLKVQVKNIHQVVSQVHKVPVVYLEVKVQVMTGLQVGSQKVLLQFHHTQGHRSIAQILELCLKITLQYIL